MISSSSNGQIKNLMQLQKKAKARNEQDVFVIEGIKMYEEVPKDKVVKVYISESLYNDILLKYSEEYFNNVSYEVVKDTVFKEVSDTITPQGIMAIIKKQHYDLKDILNQEAANLVILEDLRDPGNLGTIIRTSEGAGVTGIILSKSCVDLYNPKVIRSTMGSIYRMPYIYVEDLKDTLEKAKKCGVALYAAHLAGRKDYDKEDYTKKCGILIGNEANGLSEEIAELADRYIKIPMEGRVESLNAAIAAAILMYEIYRQRRY
ncbi:TrmH family RNA methyltransferase [Mobilisporobacter senegalensis]|uniref:TrmH family RNA methyltransferase n=1 Tax=Mobilisporobacter senegalensis TaxID=1329262 RepID=A0A3N1Y1W0_9FIRM|nr:RNA methyltransferase [Mobilisporobacter senegalensis]ROR31512.1 TrmH family RNA methyltransferase [Mobilisporobacter senegalensis]